MDRVRVLIAGGGIAGVEALLALSQLAPDRVELTMVAPEDSLHYHPAEMLEPFAEERARAYPLRRLADTAGGRLIRGAARHVDVEAREVTLESGHVLAYDALLVAAGARREQALPDVLTWTPAGGRKTMDRLLGAVRRSEVRRAAFVVPAPAAWPLPAYELALLTAREARRLGRRDVTVFLVTPEEAPLGLFGVPAAAAVREDLEHGGVRLVAASYVRSVQPGSPFRLRLSPGDRTLEADRVIALPRLRGPALPGLPADPGGFLPVDELQRVRGAGAVWAAGDGTDFPVKQGGLAAQQAETAATAIAASAGAAVEPEPFRPVLRGILLTGGRPRFMQAALAGGGGEGRTSTTRIWWPPVQVAGKRLAPYLAARDHDLVIDPIP